MHCMHSYWQLALLVSLSISLVKSYNIVIENRKLFVDGIEYFVKGINYNPTPLGYLSVQNGYGGGGYCSAKLTPYNEWKSACYDSDYFDSSPDVASRWPAGPEDGFAALWRRDFPLIKQMGVNTLRLYNANPTTRAYSIEYNNIVPLPLGKNHTAFMDLAHFYGLKIIFPLFSDYDEFRSLPVEIFKRFLRAQIDEVGNHPALLMWQLGNEMGWNGKKNFGLYNSSVLMERYNSYTEFARQYTYSKYGRRVPITVGIADSPFTFNNLMRDYDVDVFSLNVFRGVTTTTLFTGIPNVTSGFQWLTCAYSKPLLISEFGFTGSNYKAASINQLYSDFISHYSSGLIGAVYFEYSNEAQKKESQSNMGAVSVQAQVNGSQNGNQSDVFLPDIVTPKQQFYDLWNGTYKGVAYNFNTDPFALIGRNRYTLGSSVDECVRVGTFVNCPGKESPPCSGHGRCDRTSGYCNCSSGWHGADCSVALCPGDTECNKAGNCSILVSPPECICDEGFFGETCNLTVPTIAMCPKGCTNGNGVCNITCECHDGWTEYDCSKVQIYNPFPEPPSTTSTITMSTMLDTATSTSTTPTPTSTHASTSTSTTNSAPAGPASISSTTNSEHSSTSDYATSVTGINPSSISTSTSQGQTTSVVSTAHSLFSLSVVNLSVVNLTILALSSRCLVAWVGVVIVLLVI